MFDQNKLDQEMTREAERQAAHRAKRRRDEIMEKQLRKAIKDELPRAIARQNAAGWPNASEERVSSELPFGRPRIVKLLLLCGEPLSLPLDFNGSQYGHLLGDDGNFYVPNSSMWLEPKIGLPPYEVDHLDFCYKERLIKILDVLRAL